MESPAVIYFVRHGLVHDPQLVVYGRLPRFRLDEVGRRQVEAAAGWLRYKPIAQVFGGPLLRARQSARIILAHFPGLRLHISRLLQEVSTPFEGLPRSAGEARRWDLYSGTGPEYEQPAQVLARGQKFIATVRQRYPGQQIVAVTHGDVIAFLALWAHGMPVTPQLKERFFPATGSISTFTFHTSASDEVPQYQYVVPYQT